MTPATVPGDELAEGPLFSTHADSGPQPPRVPLPALAQTLWSVFAMDSFIQFCLRRFPGEPLIAFRIAGFGEIVSVLDPALIRELFAADSDLVRAGEANAQVLGTLGPDSLLVLDGERHLRTRRQLLPPFHGEAIRHHERVIAQITAAELRRWPLNEPFALWPRMRAITMEVILQTVIGVRDQRRRARLAELLPAFLGAGIFGMLGEVRFPALSGRSLARRLPWLAARKEGEALLYEEIADHRAKPEGREDVLATLLCAPDQQGRGPSDSELRAHLLTLLGAGHDTTAAALAWCFERLMRHPDALARCQRDGGSDQEYLDAAINETLRLRPVVESAARRLSGPFELGGYRLPAGITVTASIAAMQRSPAIYPEPLRFQPERFLGQRPAPYAFIPFGGGARRCIGASFALMEIRTVLRTVLAQLTLRAPDLRDERPNRIRSVSIVPARGARAIATARPRLGAPFRPAA